MIPVRATGSPETTAGRPVPPPGGIILPPGPGGRILRASPPEGRELNNEEQPFMNQSPGMKSGQPWRPGLPLFWLLQTAGWLLFLLANLAAFAWQGSLDRAQWIRYASATVSAFAITALLRGWFRNRWRTLPPLPRLLPPLLLVSLLAANAQIWLANLLRWPLTGFGGAFPPVTLLDYLQRMFWWLVPITGWIAMYFTIKFWQARQIQERRAEAARALAEAAQFQMLRYRLNPEFLFGTLQYIQDLIGRDRQHARRLITELSDFLRYNLLGQRRRVVPLREELEAIRNYINIQQRFPEERLELALETDGPLLDTPLPPFLLLPLVENAVRNGQEPSEGPFRICIKAGTTGNGWRLSVDSPPPVRSAGKDDSPDLGHVRHRLQQHYPGRHELSVTEGPDRLSITIQLFSNERIPEMLEVNKVFPSGDRFW